MNAYAAQRPTHKADAGQQSVSVTVGGNEY